ncbi:alanine racemase, catabolic [Methyloversatilis universalis FAM5]|uniref:Alanine racemase n=1 Tax=Methyloversatilis universalis (strain ATCC BAA-1314 / DSM 25237 / JCM 13912 / CCUG 52030 / FAM5) TaxID=1000565 RepID=F5RAH3_METUF|nr:alanine racemase [Methyloversatilis universalis]EGK72422.1 alanine racemase, catabolic [Methyloversatilis universalis FAM5]
MSRPSFTDSFPLFRPIHARIDFDALRHNYLRTRELAGGARMWAVIKANAYGHGIMRIARGLSTLADGFALLDLEDAVRLREAGISQPILLLEGFFSARDLPEIAARKLSTVVHTAEQLDWLESAQLPAGARIPLFLKVNTGMNRLGISPAQVPAALARLRAWPHAGPIGLMTHFADADGERGVDAQLARFAPLAAQFDGPVSMANSAALLRFPQTHADWVRPGILLYGASPATAYMTAADIGLKPVMRFEARVIAVQQLQPGDRVGYGGLFAAERSMRIGTVACGYADGYPRHAPSGTPVAVDGVRSRLVGRVSMDMIAVDLTDIPQAGLGSVVELWGEHVSLDEVAQRAGTVNYELVCALALRVPAVEVGVADLSVTEPQPAVALAR